jgi:hypothetical protein
MTNNIYVLTGMPRHGKSELAKAMVTRAPHLKAGATSSLVYEVLAKTEGLDPTADWHDVIPEPEQNEFRKRLVTLGDAMCDVYSPLLAVGLVERGISIIDGVRRKRELKAFRAYCKLHRLSCHVIWIHRDHPTVKDNTELGPYDADQLILNSGTIEDLDAVAVRVLRTILQPVTKRLSNRQLSNQYQNDN